MHCKYVIFLIAFTSSYGISMEMPDSTVRIQNAIRSALVEYNIDPNSVRIITHINQPFRTACESNERIISALEDTAHNEDFLTYHSFHVAALLKDNATKKQNTEWWIGLTLPTLSIASFSVGIANYFVSEHPALYAVSIAAGGLLGLKFGNIVADVAYDASFDVEYLKATKTACLKLLALKKFKPLSTHLAYLHGEQRLHHAGCRTGKEHALFRQTLASCGYLTSFSSQIVHNGPGEEHQISATITKGPESTRSTVAFKFDPNGMAYYKFLD